MEFAIRDWHKTYNVKALEYGPEHENLITDLEELLARVDAMRATFGATTA
jgi:hypothetical protein